MKKKIAFLAVIILAVATIAVAIFLDRRGNENSEKAFVPGLYQTGAAELYASGNVDTLEDMLIMSWADLVKNEILYVKATRVYTQYQIVDGKIVNASSSALAGDLILPSDGSVTYLGYADLEGRTAFAGCTELTGIYVPAIIKDMCDDTFRDCTALTDVYFHPDSKFVDFHQGNFRGCTSLTQFTIPDNVTLIGKNVFADCVNLQEIRFGTYSKVEKIRENAFAGCTALQSIILPKSLLTTDVSVFAGCDNLKTVEFLAPIYIDKDFWGTTSVTTIRFNCNAPLFTADAFAGMTVTIYYPVENSSWIPEMCQSYGGTVNWLPLEG